MDRAAPSRQASEADPFEAVRRTPLRRIATNNIDAVNAVRRRVLHTESGLVSIGATPFNSAI